MMLLTSTPALLRCNTHGSWMLRGMLYTSAAQHITNYAGGHSQQTLRGSCSVCSAGPPGRWLRRMQTAATPALQARINHTEVLQPQPQLMHRRVQMLAAPVLGLGSSHPNPKLAHTLRCAASTAQVVHAARRPQQHQNRHTWQERRRAPKNDTASPRKQTRRAPAAGPARRPQQAAR